MNRSYLGGRCQVRAEHSSKCFFIASLKINVFFSGWIQTAMSINNCLLLASFMCSSLNRCYREQRAEIRRALEGQGYAAIFYVSP